MTDPLPLVVSPDIESQRTLELLRRPLEEIGRVGPFRFVLVPEAADPEQPNRGDRKVGECGDSSKPVVEYEMSFSLLNEGADD